MIAETVRSHPRPGSNSSGNIVAAPLTKGSASGEGVNAPGRRQEDDVNIVAFHPTGGGAKGLSPEENVAPGTGTGTGGTVAVAFPLARRGRDGGSDLEVGEEGVYNALRAGDGGSSRLNQVMVDQAVRRLTPRECERLQGLPDDWTLLDPKTPDSRRYSALGDAVTASVAEWIGGRL